MTEVCHIEHQAQSALDSLHVVGGKVAHLITHLAVLHVQLADEMRQFTGIDFHRTGGGAKSVGSTCLVAIILIRLLQPLYACRILACCLQMKNLALDGNTHTRRQGKSARHAIDFAEAALDTLVGLAPSMVSLVDEWPSFSRR